jgi:hypothetical protein
MLKIPFLAMVDVMILAEGDAVELVEHGLVERLADAVLRALGFCARGLGQCLPDPYTGGKADETSQSAHNSLGKLAWCYRRAVLQGIAVSITPPALIASTDAIAEASGGVLLAAADSNSTHNKLTQLAEPTLTRRSQARVQSPRPAELRASHQDQRLSETCRDDLARECLNTSSLPN